uniref:DEK-C domain-containing protein n=1 Tax=Rhizophora mucronata TaxID=61149 RepID=A0A2P2LVT2_RHIMU
MEEEADSKEDEEIGEQDKMKKVEEKNDKNHMKEEKNTELNEEKESKTSGKGKRRAEKKSVEGKVGKKKKVAEEKEQETRTPASDRPQRERKSVERLVASIERDSGKEFQIEKGRGTPLKDIPNVAFKLSRKKTDDTFKLLHSILFGRRGKAIQIKTNISRFSGFVWHENEEKQKIKVKEKFDKINKEKLLEFCDVLDIPIARATTRKEDIVIKLIDFLVSPHATTTVLLAEREKGSKSLKRKRVVKSSNRSAKSRRKVGDASKTDHKSFPDSEDESEGKEEDEEEWQEKVEEENESGTPEKSNAEVPEHSSSEEKNESEEDTRKRKRSSKMPSRKKESTGKSKNKKLSVANKSSPPPKRTPKKSSSRSMQADDDSDATPKVSSRKKDEKVEKSSAPKKSASKERSGKRTARQRENAKEEKVKPSDDELKDAICEILKVVDFNTATFTDILKLLGKHSSLVIIIIFFPVNEI